jgi:hypothetical protein
MRALTPAEISQLKVVGDDLTTITVTGHPPPPITSSPLPPPPGSPPPPPPPPTFPCPANPTNTVNNSYIKANEGPSSTSGYVPNKGVGVGSGSGVTVGNGVDLANWSRYTLVNVWGMSTAGYAAISPYVGNAIPKIGVRKGPVGAAAQALLSKNGPINLSTADTNAVTNGALGTMTGVAAIQFQNLSGNNFYDLPSGVQTALADLVYNTGGFYSAALPSGVTTAIANKDWSQLATMLQDSGHSRWAQDGNAIAGAVQAGHLPSAGNVCN